MTEEILQDLLQTEGGELAYSAARAELMKMPIQPLIASAIVGAEEGETIEEAVAELHKTVHLRAVSVVRELLANLERGIHALN